MSSLLSLLPAAKSSSSSSKSSQNDTSPSSPDNTPSSPSSPHLDRDTDAKISHPGPQEHSSKTTTDSSSTKNQQKKLFQYSYRERFNALKRRNNTTSFTPQNCPLPLPKNVSDFGEDAGAFPEIHLTQFPMGMGNKHQLATVSSSSTSLATATPAQNRDNVQQMVLQGHREGKVVYSSFKDLIEKQLDDEQLQRPTKEDEKANAEETQLAIENRVQQKIKSAYKLNLSEQRRREEQVDYVKYTPLDSITGKAGQTKIIQVVEEERDPMEPSRFKNRKLPARPPSPPVPVMRAPDKKLTNEDMEKWKIPPCVSNWKNKSGFVVPLDKRMAADGRGLQKTQINDRFASLAQAVYSTERTVRDEIEQRKEYQRAVERKMKEQEEEQMRRLAEEANEERQFTEEELAGYREREQIRRQVRDETYEDHRKEMMRRKKAFYSNDEDDEDERDVSERVALGSHAVSSSASRARTQGSTGYQFDSRLEQEASTDMGSGFGNDDDYNVYDKPLVNRSSASVLYRPRQSNIESFQGDVEDVEKSVRSRFTRGTASLAGDGSERRARGSAVSFHSESNENEHADREAQQQPQDEFAFLTGGNDSNNKRKRALDHIGRSGFMRATGGGASSDLDHYRGSKRQRIEFSKSSSSK